ncbi:MAG: MCE family protein [Deltaproteobacteria bacterium]|nr:MCE family protein [Deltaproteobacteria bacterium]
MNLDLKSREQVVGIFLVVTLFILTGAIVFIAQGKNWFREHERYYTYFKEGYNLAPGSKVTLFNTRIGKVVGAEITEDNRVRVEISILAEFASRVRKDTIVTVKSPTIIGSEYIAIMPGTPDLPLIPPGNEIPSKEKKALGDYMEEFKVEEKLQLVVDIITNIKEITDQLKNPEGDLFKTLNHIEQLSASLKAPDGPLFAALENIREATAKLKDPHEGLFQTLDNLASISAKMKDGEGTVGRLLVKEDLYQQIDKEVQKVDAILSDLQTLSAGLPAVLTELEMRIKELKDPFDSLGAALQDAPEVMGAIRGELNEIGKIIESLKENFLIKGNLPQPLEEKTIPYEGRGE